MDDSLYFTEHHQQVREMVRDFSRTHIAPVAAELDQTSTFPWENIKGMGELGLLGVPWSEELGGAGMDQLSYYITIHEMAKVDASHAITISAHTISGLRPSWTSVPRSRGGVTYPCWRRARCWAASA